MDEHEKTLVTFTNGKFKSLEDNVDTLKETVGGIKNDMSEIKRRLLDPETGVIHKMNEATVYVGKLQKEETLDQIKLVKKANTNVSRLFWLVMTFVIGSFLSQVIPDTWYPYSDKYTPKIENVQPEPVIIPDTIAN